MMRIKGSGNAVAIALAGLAVVLAASGTAYAVTSSTVNIADPLTPSHIAHVDSSSRLLTVGATSTIANSANFSATSTTYLTSPTTASLAITEVQVAETRLNGTANGSDLFVQIAQVTTSGGSCTSNVLRTLFVSTLASGQVIDLAPTAPMVVKPNGSTPYCLALLSLIDTGGTDATSHYSQFRFAGYVASGTYTGIGTAASPAKVNPRGDRK